MESPRCGAREDEHELELGGLRLPCLTELHARFLLPRWGLHALDLLFDHAPGSLVDLLFLIVVLPADAPRYAPVFRTAM